jgi:hypothetical protein
MPSCREEFDMTDPANVEVPPSRDLTMSVVGYTVSYDRGLELEEPLEGPAEVVMQSLLTLSLDVRGATVEHHHNRPIKFATVNFSEGPLDPDHVGFLHDVGTAFSIIAKLPKADFAAFWAALRLEREATLVCSIALRPDGAGTDRVSGLKVRGRRS